MSLLDSRPQAKNYNQTTTKWCDICDFWAWFKNGPFRVTVDGAWAQPPKEAV